MASVRMSVFSDGAPMKRRIGLIAASAALVLVGVMAVIVFSPRATPVTENASAATVALFDSLQSQRGHGILFGQHLAFDVHISEQVDIFSSVGDYPAIFGWDTRAIEGSEPPTTLENVVSGIQRAHAIGGVNEISAHMSNFVTGGDYADTSGGVVESLLADTTPLDNYLDDIVSLASLSVDSEGELIPIIFRPFHEGNGDWFWWGAGETSVDNYKLLFRHTVTYLQEAGTTNVLYAWSPNGPFAGDESRYLETYPGDDVVDIMGYDSYESHNDAENSDEWIGAVTADLALVSRAADSRGKIPAFTEFGRNGDRTIRASGNRSLTFFTDLFESIDADRDARRMAYMMTWANWDRGQVYVPYPGHEMLPDFQTFYDHENTVFAREWLDSLEARR
ncbi:MAG: glycoside hydrolase family 26 protein [Microbacteriaceae bacterium]